MPSCIQIIISVDNTCIHVSGSKSEQSLHKPHYLCLLSKCEEAGVIILIQLYLIMQLKLVSQNSTQCYT